MAPRPARIDDAPEVVRLAGLMYEAMGLMVDDAWAEAAVSSFQARLDDDVAAFVVDDPTTPGQLSASGCGVVSTRLPSPANPEGRVGYIMWMATDPAFRRQGHGAGIVNALVDWFRSHGVAMVELHATAEGESVYRRAGFGTEGALAMRRPTW
jgi:GNAT superfamily N-acetyltransferase